MNSKSILKWQRTVATVILAPILICLVVISLTACIFPHEDEISYNQAIAIAKKDFGCDKILWINTNAAVLSGDPLDTLYEKLNRNKYEYYVVGEKDGEEIYIIVPDAPKRNKPFVTTWAFDYSFSQIVEKFNECGVQYVADVPDDYYSENLDSHIKVDGEKDLIKRRASYYIDDVDVDLEMFYESLDVKALFLYEWDVGENRQGCIVVQENGELKAYKK